jgi:hypothetical protein
MIESASQDETRIRFFLNRLLRAFAERVGVKLDNFSVINEDDLMGIKGISKESFSEDVASSLTRIGNECREHFRYKTEKGAFEYLFDLEVFAPIDEFRECSVFVWRRDIERAAKVLPTICEYAENKGPQSAVKKADYGKEPLKISHKPKG